MMARGASGRIARVLRCDTVGCEKSLPRRLTMWFSRALLLAMLALPGAALAQPSQKPIRIIVPFAPGASADGIARAIANDLGARTGRPVVVENRVGAGGSLGLTVVAKAPPDGDTLGIG